MLDMKGKAEWDAWKAKEGMSQDDAKAAYIAKAQEKVYPDKWLAGIKDNLHYADEETGDETIESRFPIRRKRDRL